MGTLRAQALLTFLAASCACAAAAGEEISLPVVRDVWLCGEGTMRDASMSRTHTLKLRGTRDAALLDFDRLRLQGMRISKAELFLHRAEPAGGTRDVTVAVSTVSSQWVEGRFSIPYRKDPVGRGATFNQASNRSYLNQKDYDPADSSAEASISSQLGPHSGASYGHGGGLFGGIAANFLSSRFRPNAV